MWWGWYLKPGLSGCKVQALSYEHPGPTSPVMLNSGTDTFILETMTRGFRPHLLLRSCHTSDPPSRENVSCLDAFPLTVRLILYQHPPHTWTHTRTAVLCWQGHRLQMVSPEFFNSKAEFS